MVLSPSEAIIIVVEDNADNLFIVTDILTADLGVRTVYESASGRQLFALLDRHPTVTPHLILLDLVWESVTVNRLPNKPIEPRLAALIDVRRQHIGGGRDWRRLGEHGRERCAEQ